MRSARWSMLSPVLFVGLTLLAALTLFAFLQRRLTGSWPVASAHPDVLAAVALSLEDQRLLARLDPGGHAAYRGRFDDLATLDQRLRVLQHARGDLARRYRQILFGIFGVALVGASGAWLWRQSRQERRLEDLRVALESLARGESGLRLGPRRHDVIGRIAAMVEETSEVMAKNRRRLRALENLSAWQEAARRHAHEMRTPLTGARLELRKLTDLVAGWPGEHELAGRLRAACEGVDQELDRLGVFARGFTSFARLPAPRLAPTDLGPFLARVAETFGDAWPGVRLVVEHAPGVPSRAAADTELLRQVLINLIDNSAQAMADDGAGDMTDGVPGRVTLRLQRPDADADDQDADGHPRHVVLDVVDDGPGIDPRVRPRLFEPYTTTRGIGDGMGLGLAISRKLLLDQGGELELLETSEGGTTFRLTLPAAEGPSSEAFAVSDDTNGEPR